MFDWFTPVAATPFLAFTVRAEKSGTIRVVWHDDDGSNVEKIGHLNVGQALHPVVLKDSRIIFSSLEMQGKHNTGWGILGIHPDGTNWDPVVSALSLGGAPCRPQQAHGQTPLQITLA